MASCGPCFSPPSLLSQIPMGWAWAVCLSPNGNFSRNESSYVQLLHTFLTLPPPDASTGWRIPQMQGRWVIKIITDSLTHGTCVCTHTRTRRGWHWPRYTVAKRMSFSITQMGQSLSNLTYELSILAFYSVSLSFLNCKGGIITPTS